MNKIKKIRTHEMVDERELQSALDHQQTEMIKKLDERVKAIEGYSERLNIWR